MQLVGNIEDLGLGEILQIVSFSRKSGILKLNSKRRTGTIVFKDGSIVRASASTLKEGLGDHLVKEGVITPDLLDKARKVQGAEGYSRDLGTVLIKDLGVSAGGVDEAASKIIEKTVYALFLWYEGNFIFELADFSETPEFLKADHLQFTLARGMNPQFLAMEGARLLDEFKREGGVEELPQEEEAPPPPPAPPIPPAPEPVIEVAREEPAIPIQEVPPAPAPAPAAEKKQPVVLTDGMVLIIDDDPLTRGYIRNHLVQCGFNAVAFGQQETFLGKVSELIRQGKTPVVVVDYFMPRMDGEGVTGGVELLVRLKEEYPSINVIMMTEHIDPKIESEVKGLNPHSFIQKPKKLQFKEDATTYEVTSFLDDLAKILGPLSPKKEQKKAEESSPFLLQDYLKEMESGDSFLEQPVSEDHRVEVSKGLMLLKEMLSELSRPLSLSEIVLLVLRFSSEIMNRAVVFAVKKDSITGLGQFGVEIEGEIPDVHIRRMKIPLDQPSILTEAAKRGGAVIKRLEPSQWNDYIVKELGGHKPAESFVAPVMAQGKAVLILYADNVPKSDPVGDTSTLEIFLSQASMALERTILEKKSSESAVY